MKIVAMDLGKFKSVVCEYDSVSGKHTFRTIRTAPQEVHDVLVEKMPDRVATAWRRLFGGSGNKGRSRWSLRYSKNDRDRRISDC